MSTSTGPEAPTDWSALEDRALLGEVAQGVEEGRGAEPLRGARALPGRVDRDGALRRHAERQELADEGPGEAACGNTSPPLLTSRVAVDALFNACAVSNTSFLIC